MILCTESSSGLKSTMLKVIVVRQVIYSPVLIAFCFFYSIDQLLIERLRFWNVFNRNSSVIVVKKSYCKEPTWGKKTDKRSTRRQRIRNRMLYMLAYRPIVISEKQKVKLIKKTYLQQNNFSFRYCCRAVQPTWYHES